MMALVRGALGPLLIGIAILAMALHFVDAGYEDVGRAFVVFGFALVGSSVLFYAGLRSRSTATVLR